MEMAFVGTVFEALSIGNGNSKLHPKIEEVVSLAPQCFVDPRTGRVMSVIRRMRNQHLPIDIDTVLAMCVGFDEDEKRWVQYMLESRLPMVQVESDAVNIARQYDIRSFHGRVAELIEQLQQTPALFVPVIREIALMVSKAESRFAAEKEVPRPATRIDALNYIPPENDELLLPSYLTLGEVTIITGAGGAGKSRLVLQLAVDQILGRQWCGLHTAGDPQTWLFEGHENNWKRWKADFMRVSQGLTADQTALIDKHIHYTSARNWRDRFLSMKDEASVYRLRKQIEMIKPGVIVFDPFIKYMIGNVKETEDVIPTINALRELVYEHAPDAAIVLIHHARTGRINVAMGADHYDRANFLFGSKSLIWEARCVINLMPGMAEDLNQLVLSCAKVNNCQPFEDRAIRLNEETGLYEVDPDVDLEDWRNDVTGKRTGKTCPIADIISVVQEGIRTAPKIVEKLAETGVGRATIYRRLRQAVEKGYLEQPFRGQYLLGFKGLKS